MRDGWEGTTLGQVATTVGPSRAQGVSERYVGLEHFDSGSPRIARWASTAEVSSPTTAFEPGDVLFSKLRPYLRKVAVADFAGRCTTEALVYRPSRNDLEAGYLGLILQSAEAISHATSTSAGSRMPRTSVHVMASLPVTLPPLMEQRRIVDLLGALDATLAACDAGPAQRAYESMLAVLAVNDQSSPLERALRQRCDGSTVMGASEYRILGVLRSGQGFIDRGTIRGTETGYTKLHQVGEDELVYRKLTAWEGPISVSTKAESGGWVSPEFPVFTIDDSVLRPGLLRHFCRWPGFWQRIEDRLVGSVQRRKRLNPEGLLGIRLPMPALGVQDAWIEALDALWEAAAARNVTASGLRLVRSSLLALLLSGEHKILESYDELMGVAS